MKAQAFEVMKILIAAVVAAAFMILVQRALYRTIPLNSLADVELTSAFESAMSALDPENPVYRPTVPFRAGEGVTSRFFYYKTGIPPECVSVEGGPGFEDVGDGVVAKKDAIVPVYIYCEPGCGHYPYCRVYVNTRPG